MVDSKFEPCRPSVDLVQRERLLKILQDGANKKLVLIVAPAGYGKSSLLGQLVSGPFGENHQYSWLTLDVGEVDEKQFLACLVLALSKMGVDIEELVTGARNGYSDSDTKLVLSKIIQSLNKNAAPRALILEDYHNAECAPVNAIIKQLLREAPANFTIFIDSRRQPEIDAFSLIAAGDAVEINAAQLRLTQEETLTALSDVTGGGDSLEIYRQTEGWPVAVQLARVQKRTSPTARILAGVDGGFIASYLTEQVLSSLDADTQEFLLAVSFLDRFNPDLTNFVMDSPNGWARIDSLSSLAALFVPLDREGGWYRLHHLFAEYLRELQTKRDQTRAVAYILRASDWYLSQGDIVPAVRYAAEAKDFEKCEAIIRGAGGWSIILTDGIGVLRNALRLVPVAHEKSSAALLLARAYLHCKDGKIQQARATLNAALPLIDKGNDERLTVDRLLVESLINLYEDRDGWTPSYSNLRLKYEDGGGLSALEFGTLKCQNFLAQMTQAEFEKSAIELRDAFSQMRESGSVLGLNYCYIHAAHLALHRADFEIASANIDRALEMAEENFGSDSGLKNIALVLQFALKIWQGRAGHADRDPFKTAFFHTLDYDGWTDIYITGLEAAILLAKQCGDDQYVLDIINSVIPFARERSLVRLGNFAYLSRLLVSPLSNLGLENDKVLEQFLPPHSIEQSSREWQSFVLAAAVAERKARHKKGVLKMLDAMASFAVERNAFLKVLFLEAVRARLSLENETDVLLHAVKRAAAQRIWGPFIADPIFIEALRKQRAALRHKEDELLTLKFVDEILERAGLLNPKPKKGKLSDREYEILQHLAEGQSNKEIARALELTENTVKFHLKSLYAKLSVSKRTQAVVEAQKQGLID